MSLPSKRSVAEFAIGEGGSAFADQILAIIGDAHPLQADERRSGDRFPIFGCYEITPLDSTHRSIIDETTTVVGKDLSINGICFSHEHELAYNRVIVSLPHSEKECIRIEAEIAWTRHTAIGLYESGCRLIRKIENDRYI